MADLRFGVAVAPVAAELDTVVGLARSADEAGLDLFGVQDHPYVADFVDTMSLIGHLLAATRHLRVFPDVANLPLRTPALLAKQAASLDLLSDGRFELGLGAGASQPAVGAMGSPVRTPGQAFRALEEGIAVIRAMWDAGHAVRADGEHYRLAGIQAGPAPAHQVGIWLGSVGPRMLELTGRLADGWAAPIAPYLPYEHWPAAMAAIDAGAREAGREPSEVVRVAHLVGTVTEAPTGQATTHAGLRGSAPIQAGAGQWADLIRSLAEDVGFDTFVFCPAEATPGQLDRWAREVVPAVRGSRNS
ncbi:luciferase-like monooxygenase [Saccharopolyspora erythraea NRRL 2338]|uniref:Coenzyme F420-dependent N(5),N(10)-methylenetetrahydromethanopterin reductase n=2 Tax=Saccharopolyspora erythraea TaxID=1836 RepID=A4FDL6_SACEN|nr:LLM class flavin-dependent oxidoreductase [Saccharopolyspora erythraea]EQD81854.1 N5,N10-methylene tetrahydromethanopterin reductase [Saccharopolyspora erythraea D]PFG95876.1 luciferase-like monooxygenase [Saccharopolyspora erythraea NRRL 2338]QRK92454.1 LLM class flavin-dependent oxidoreductase [Saccharopolyspora erythraea]CAM02141.1 coenzyme F420-dependent N(5),N(10)-methylenetetrahydromethanopterin reductase [Saccharopolyspora erythraea NRRL 2338]